MTEYELVILQTAALYKAARRRTEDASEYYHSLPDMVKQSTKSLAWDAWCDAQDAEREALVKLVMTIAPLGSK